MMNSPSVGRVCALLVVLLLAVPELVAQRTAVPPSAMSPRTSFHVGDRILVTVQNEPTLSDTFTVTPALTIVMPMIGDVSLANVDREQLTQHLTTVLEKYVRHPVVRTRVLVRIGIVGEVTKPGWYAVPADGVLADALMAAGGPTKDAKVDKMYVDRNGKHLIGDTQLRQAIARSATVDQLALQAGDEVKVPRIEVGKKEAIVRVVAMLVTIPLAVWTISRARQN